MSIAVQPVMGLRSSAPLGSRCSRPGRPSVRVMRARALFGGGGAPGSGGPGGKDEGMFKNMQGLFESVRKAQQVVQVEAVKIQKELAETEFYGYSRDDLVRVTMTGSQEPRAVEINPEAMDLDADELGQLCTEALKSAHEKSVAAMKERMKELAESLGLPANAVGGGGPPS